MELVGGFLCGGFAPTPHSLKQKANCCSTHGQLSHKNCLKDFKATCYKFAFQSSAQGLGQSTLGSLPSPVLPPPSSRFRPFLCFYIKIDRCRRRRRKFYAFFDGAEAKIWHVCQKCPTLKEGGESAQNVPTWAQSAHLPPTPLNILRTITEFWNAWYNARLALRAQLKKFPYLKPKSKNPYNL